MERHTPPTAAPEWVVADRGDLRINADELVGGWVTRPSTVTRGSAYTDLSRREMAVPEGDSDIARAIQQHELAHARFSPIETPRQLCEQIGVSLETVRIAEETRINLFLSTTDVPRRHAPLNEEMARLNRLLSDGTEGQAADSARERDDFRQAVYLMFGTYGLDCFRTVKRRLKMKKEWSKAVEGISDYLKAEFPLSRRWSSVPRFASTDAVRYVWVDGKETTETMLPLGFTELTLDIAQQMEAIIANGGAGTKRVEKGEDGEKAEEEEPGGEKGMGRVSRIPWVGLRIGITALTEQTASFIGRRKRPSITGKYPRRPDRLITDPDRRIFRETVRGAGGVVVFDCSGSMGVEHDTIQQTAELFAGATILAYSMPPHGNKGQANAWVLARNGRLISGSEMRKLPLNRGNGVDGEALRWAVRQRKTRKDFVLWVSDFGVTGKNDDQCEELMVDCAEIVRRERIIQVESCREAISLLTEMKRTGRVPHGSTTNAHLRHYIDGLRNGTVARVTVPVVHH
jgi:hypothetical protein